MVERVDYYSDDEFHQAQQAEEEYYQQIAHNQQAEEESAYNAYILEEFNNAIEDELSDILP